MHKIMEPVTTSHVPETKTAKRQYYIDWIRVLAFCILIFFHSGMFFVSWGWHVKNNEVNYIMEYPMEWLHLWRLPLLFFISGVGVSFAMKSRTGWQFIGERTKRLLLPLVFGMFVIVPPQIYFERLQSGQFNGSYLDFYPNVFNFIPYPKGDFSWHHLWFVAYLWVFSLLCTPLFLWLKSDNAKKIIAVVKAAFTNIWGVLLLSVIPMILYWTLRDRWPVSNNLISDWYNFTLSLTIFIYGYLIGTNQKIWDLVEKYRISLISVGTFIIVFRISFDAIFGSIPDDLPYMPFINGVLTMVSLWTTILGICGFAKHYLNFKNSFLTYSTEAVYPFYILHQTITVAIGFHIADWDLNVWLKLSILVLGTFGFSLFIYHFLIRPFNFTRLLFGVKGK